MHTEELLDVMFAPDHVIAEIFWNGVFLIVGYFGSKLFAWRKIHKYIDDKHGVKHEKDKY